MKNIFYTLIFIFVSLTASAQQETNYTFFMYNQQAYNPAYVGSRGIGSFTALYRNQWTGFEGAPQSQLLSFQSPFLGENQGIGATVMRFEMGITSNWMTNLAYSYRLKISDDWGMRLGLQGVFRYQGINFQDEKVVLSVLDDPSISTGEETENYNGNVGAGLYLTYKDLFYFGASAPSIYKNDISINPSTSIENPAEYKPHFYFSMGGRIPFNENVALSPNLLVKYVKDAPTNFDLNANLIFYEQFVIGVSGRNGSSGTFDSVDLLMMYQFSGGFGLGFSYDYTLSEIKNYSSGSYELMLRYDLGGAKNDLENPRYF
jgi:type IX secretion system PorP/SprF family membrane protein